MPTDKCLSPPASKKNLSTADRYYYRKPQLVKVQTRGTLEKQKDFKSQEIGVPIVNVTEKLYYELSTI